ncbi:MAG: hypothetical protein NTZ71_02285 [Planctomycetota bacterium]|jgi:hypothetical protein|nr:hypothetical protein [Planctomycetota bacterium]
MNTKVLFVMGCLASMGTGCMTAPNLSGLITTSKSAKVDTAEKQTVAAPAEPVRKQFKAVRAADVTPGQTRETIQALQEELDAAAQ